MHNHIKSNYGARPSMSKQPSYSSASGDNGSRMKEAFDSVRGHDARQRFDKLGKTVAPTIDFEGFGSFSG